jgi:predicted HTH transcriptional regulator
VPEIPPSVFEELLVNALAHRDSLVSAPIWLFIFDNRIDKVIESLTRMKQEIALLVL